MQLYRLSILCQYNCTDLAYYVNTTVHYVYYYVYRGVDEPLGGPGIPSPPLGILVDFSRSDVHAKYWWIFFFFFLFTFFKYMYNMTYWFSIQYIDLRMTT